MSIDRYAPNCQITDDQLHIAIGTIGCASTAGVLSSLLYARAPLPFSMLSDHNSRRLSHPVGLEPSDAKARPPTIKRTIEAAGEKEDGKKEESLDLY